MGVVVHPVIRPAAIVEQHGITPRVLVFVAICTSARRVRGLSSLKSRQRAVDGVPRGWKHDPRVRIQTRQ
jgi:hypothetical protein